MNRDEKHLIAGFLLISVISLSAKTFAVDFASLAAYPVGNAPGSIVAADFDGDGKMDLAVANFGSRNVSILLGNEGGTFQKAVNYDAGIARAASMAVGDFNDDGKLDIAVIELSPNSLGSLSPGVLHILLGNGDGSFQAPKTNTQDVIIDWAVADFNLDHKADVAITEYDVASNSTSVVILLGNGDGSFQRSTNSGVFPGGSGFIAAADFNSDAKPDLAISVSTKVQILLGHGDGTLQTGPAVSVADGFVVQGIQSRDANGDGAPDLLVRSLRFQASPGDNEGPRSSSIQVSLLLGNGDGTLQAEQIAATSSWSKSSVFSPPVGDSIDWAALEEYDGDGKLDLALSRNTFSGLSMSGTRSLEIEPGKGDGTFLSALSFPYSNSVGATTDLNGDSLADFVFLDSNAVLVALNKTSTFKMTLAPLDLPLIHSGESTTLTIDIAALNGFSEKVDLACIAPASVEVNCSISPTSVIPGSSATLTVSTTGPSVAMAPHDKMSSFYALSMYMMGCIFVSLCFTRKRSQSSLLGLLPLLVFASLFLQTACAGGAGGPPSTGQPGTPAGQYIITITGTAGSRQGSISTTLTVQ